MKVKLQKVRLSFPALFKPKAVKDSGAEPKYGASFLLNKKEDAAQIDALRSAIKAAALEKWPAGIPKGVKFCVHDGSEKDYDGYNAEVIYISSCTIAPVVVDEALNPLTENNRKIYAGCLVNASIRLWAQDNQYGKRINAQLQAVQFAGEGEAFGDKPVDPKEEFTATATPPPDSAGESAAGDASEENIPF